MKADSCRISLPLSLLPPHRHADSSPAEGGPRADWGSRLQVDPDEGPSADRPAATPCASRRAIRVDWPTRVVGSNAVVSPRRAAAAESQRPQPRPGNGAGPGRLGRAEAQAALVLRCWGIAGPVRAPPRPMNLYWNVSSPSGNPLSAGRGCRLLSVAASADSAPATDDGAFRNCAPEQSRCAAA